MAVESGRAVFIRYTRNGVSRRGSGLRLGGCFVLTADHCVNGTGHVLVIEGREYPATVHVRSGTGLVDVAVLVAPTLPDLPAVGFALVNREHALVIDGCQSLGYPSWKGTPELPELAQPQGSVPTAEGRLPTQEAQVELLSFKIHDGQVTGHPVPDGPLDAPTSVWAGMSGSAVLTADGIVIGVVRSHAFSEGGQSLTITPLDAIRTLPQQTAELFWAAMGVNDPDSLPRLPLPQESISRSEAAREVAELLRIREDRPLRAAELSAENESVDRAPTLELLAPPLSHRFVRRDALNSAVKRILDTGTAAILVGLSGCGKTQLAAHLFRDLALPYRNRWWIRATDLDTLSGDLAELAPQLAIQVQPNAPVAITARRVVQALEATDSWLLIIDDAKGVSDEVGFLPRSGGHLIITTQNAGWGILGRRLRIPQFSTSESLQILDGGCNPTSPVDMESFHEIHELAVGHPLVIAQAASYMSATGLPPSRYATLLRERRSELIARGEDPNHANLRSSVQLALSALPVDAIDLLHTLSQLASAPFGVFALLDSDNILDVFNDELRVEDALAALRTYSLIERDEMVVSLHDLVKVVVKAVQDDSQRRRSLASALLMLLAHIPERPDHPEARKSMGWMVPHLLEIVDSPLLEQGELRQLGIMITNRVAIYLQSTGELQEARSLLERLVVDDISEITDFEEMAGLGTTLNNLGTVLGEIGDRQGAEHTLRQSLELKERSLPAGALAVGISLAALAVAVDNNGRADEAEELHQRALEIYRRHGDASHIADTLNDLANLYNRRGELIPAREFLQEAIQLTADSPSAWPELIRAYLQISQVQLELGEVSAAARCARRAVDIARSHPGTDLLGMALHVRGSLMIHLGNVVLGLRLLQEAVEAFETEGYTTSLEYARTLGDFGAAQVRYGSPSVALPFLEQSELLLRGQLAPNHISVIVARRMLGFALVRLGRSNDARALLSSAINEARATGDARHVADLEALLTQVNAGSA